MLSVLFRVAANRECETLKRDADTGLTERCGIVRHRASRFERKARNCSGPEKAIDRVVWFL
jgi:hypothetical protein